MSESTPAAPAVPEEILIRTTARRAAIIRAVLDQHVVPLRHWAAEKPEDAGEAPQLVREVDGARTDVQRALLTAPSTQT